MSIDEEIKANIAERIAKLKTGEAKRYLIADVLYPARQKEKDLKKVRNHIDELKPIYSFAKDKVKSFKKLIPHIEEQTTLCATYLIFGKVLQTWESIFLLAIQGYSFNMMELVRNIGENLDLIKAFQLDKGGKLLKRWFEGEIIEHRIIREMEDKFIKEGKFKSVEENNLSPKDIITDIYRVMSKYTHCSYVALWDCIDVFNEDFDWNGYAGAHYTANYMHALDSAMTATLLGLKITYGELKDFNNYGEVNKEFIRFAGPMDEESLKDIIPKIKK